MRILLLLSLLVTCATSAHAQFYKDKTLVWLINYGAGGNADMEGRVYSRHIAKHIPGQPQIIIQNAPGAGGYGALNTLGLNRKADGLTGGFFTVSAVGPAIEDPALKVKLHEFQLIGGAAGWTVVYARRDTKPGLVKATDLAKAEMIFAGGYSRNSSHDARLTLAMETLGVKYKLVTGFPGSNDINKAFQAGEVNLTASSLPQYQTMIVPNVIASGLGIALFHYSVVGKDGKPAGNPALEAQGIPPFHVFHAMTFGREPSGVKWEALLLLNDIGTKLQRAIVLPAGSPAEAVADLRKGFEGLRGDKAFIEEFKRVTGSEPDLVSASEAEPLLTRMAKVAPEIRATLQAATRE
jgi:hypothetical protein